MCTAPVPCAQRRGASWPQTASAGLSALHPDPGPTKPRGPTAHARDCTEDRGRPHSLPMRPSLGPLSYFRKSEKPGRRARKSSEVQARSEEHTSELQSRENLVCRLLLEKKKAIHVGVQRHAEDPGSA